MVLCTLCLYARCAELSVVHEMAMVGKMTKSSSKSDVMVEETNWNRNENGENSLFVPWIWCSHLCCHYQDVTINSVMRHLYEQKQRYCTAGTRKTDGWTQKNVDYPE